MKIHFEKTVFTEQEVKIILAKLRKAHEMGFLSRRKENNSYLKASYRGNKDKGISDKWNVKVYRYNGKRRGHSIVCVDCKVLEQLMTEDYACLTPLDLKVLSIDDAGWGFPLCGIMVGVADDKQVRTSVVPVEFFRHDTRYHFQTRRYLKVYSQLAIDLLQQFGATPDTHRIEICTGYVNQPLRRRLRGRGYHVRVVEIEGLLQDRLEELFEEYVAEECGARIYYDPKVLEKQEIPKKYRQALRYGKRYCPQLIKSGWSSIQGRF